MTHRDDSVTNNLSSCALFASSLELAKATFTRQDTQNYVKCLLRELEGLWFGKNSNNAGSNEWLSPKHRKDEIMQC